MTDDRRTKTFWLSMHVPYRCHDSGACCSAGWPIPLEVRRLPPVAQAVRDGRLAAPLPWIHQQAAQPSDIAGVLALGVGGHCVFHADPGCHIQRVLGPQALPSACAHFPRECLIDARGVSVTLSHYCPTAAALLFDHPGAVTIVEGPAAVVEEPEGLDARDVLPPLLARGVLMDHEGYAAWERHVVFMLAGAGACSVGDVDATLDLLEEDARALSTWRPGASTIAEAIARLPTRAGRLMPIEIDWDRERALIDCALGSLTPSHHWAGYAEDPAPVWRRLVVDGWMAWKKPIGRLVAAHAFASWIGYQGANLVTSNLRLRLTVAVLRAEAIRRCAEDEAPLDRARLTESIRQTDLLLVHLADRAQLAHRLCSCG
jgi:hypothetical protein